MTLKSLVFAVVAGLPLAVFPALAQNITPAPEQGTTESTQSTTVAVPPSGVYSSTTTQTGQSSMTNHEDATGQVHGPNGGVSSGK